MILQRYYETESGTKSEVIDDGIGNVFILDNEELVVNYRNGESTTLKLHDKGLRSMYLLNDEGKTIKVIVRK